MKSKKKLLALSIIIACNPALAIDYDIPLSTPTNNSNQMNTIDGSTNDIVIHNGTNGYSNLGTRGTVTRKDIPLQDAIDAGIVDSNIFATANLNNLMSSVTRVNKTITVYDDITGESHDYAVLDFENSSFNKADVSNLKLELYDPRKGKDYVDHTIASVSNGHTLTIEANTGMTSDWYKDTENQIQIAHRDSNIYKATGTDSTIEYKGKVNINPEWVPVMTKDSSNGSISATVGMFYEWNGTIETKLGSRTIVDEASFSSFNDELISALQEGTISYQDYVDSINNTYTKQYKNISYDISQDPNYVNDPIFVSVNNAFLYASDKANIHLDTNSEILITNGQFSAVTITGNASTTNDGKITGIQHHNNNLVNVLNNSEFTNNGLINDYVTTGGDYADLTIASSARAELFGIKVNTNSQFTNNGVINSSSHPNPGSTDTTDTNTSVVAIDLQNNSLLTNSGAINYGVRDATQLNSIRVNAAVQLRSGSQFYNTADGRLSIGKTAQANKTDSQADVTIDSSSGSTAGVSGTDSTILNEGTIESSAGTKNISLIRVEASRVQNDGTISLSGVNNIGINAIGSDSSSSDTVIVNNSNISIESGENNKAIVANNTSGAKAISVTNNKGATISVDGSNSFVTPGANLVRNYGMWIEGKKAYGVNSGTIALIDGGAVGIHARNGGIVYVTDTSEVTFDSDSAGSQIGYFSYGEGSLIQFNNPTEDNEVNSKNSTFARIEDGAKLLFNNDPGEFETINLNAANTIGFHVSGKSTAFLADANININIVGDASIGFLATNGGEVDISETTNATLSGNNAIFAVADGRNYKIDNTIVDGVDGINDSSIIVSRAIINDTMATGNNIIGYLANKGGTIYQYGTIDLQKGDATGIKIDGGSVVNTGSVSVNGIGVHVVGADSVYQGQGAVTATDGKAAFFIDKDASIALTSAQVVAHENAHGILLDDDAVGLAITGGNILSDGLGDVIHNNASISNPITIETATLTASGDGNAVIYHDATNATYSLSAGATLSTDSDKQYVANFNDGEGLLNVDSSTISGKIITNSGATSNVNLTEGSVWNVLYDGSNVTNLSNNNGATIDLTNKISGSYNILTVDGNYQGGREQPTESTPYPESGNGTLIVNTLWNNSESYSDLLTITGKASGYTQVKAKGDIIGDVTIGANEKYSATVVTVGDHELDSNSFYGFANTTGAGQALLVQKGANDYAWYLPAKSGPDNPVDPVNPKVPEAVLMPKANLDAGYSILGTLHERVSEQQTMAWDNCSTCQVENNDGQVWGRFIGNYNKSYGKDRYDYRSKLWGMQFGYDFSVNYDPDNNARSHTGVMLTYAKDNLSFYDSKSVYFNTTIGDYAEKNSKTGHGQSDIYSLGAYHTYYDENGSYMDFVGMFNYIRNKYNTYGESNDKNHAYGVALSAEVGRPFAITNNGRNNGDWFIEPQAQLIYQYLSYSDYKTTNHIKVDQQDQQGLRGRIGARIAYNQGNDELKTQTIYFTGNIIHDFLGQKRINFGTSHVSEKNNRTAGEVGVGIQLPLAETSYVYFDTRYYHSLGNSSGKTKAFSGTLGLKYFW